MGGCLGLWREPDSQRENWNIIPSWARACVGEAWDGADETRAGAAELALLIHSFILHRASPPYAQHRACHGTSMSTSPSVQALWTFKVMM